MSTETEVLPKPKTGDNLPAESSAEKNSASDTLRSDLNENDYKNFAKRSPSNSTRSSNLESNQTLVSDGKLTIEPLFGRTGEPTKPDDAKDKDHPDTKEKEEPKSEKATVSDQSDSSKDGKDIPLDPEAQKAKDDFVKILEERFKDDSRAQENPDLLPTLEARLAQMDQRVLHERVQRADGSFVNQQEQLANEYKNLTRIGTDAEKLTYTAKDGSEQQVYNEPWMVNNILADGIMRGADPVNFYSQGANNTCAAEALNREGNELLAGKDSETIADIATKGEFEAVDNEGKKFTCRVDKSSLRLDRQAQNIYLNPANARGAYGQLGDLRTAQLNLDLMSREKASQHGEEGGEGRFVYKKVPPTGQRDTGERVVDTNNGEVIANSPCLNAKSISDVKQSLYGRFIDPSFGKETTLVSDSAFDVSNATEIRNGSQLTAHLKMLEAKGWKLPTLATHVGNYVSNAGGLGGAEGWHATSIQSGKGSGIDFINNWGGEHNYKDLNADKLFSWMDAPANASEADRHRGDHIFNPDGIYGHGDNNPVIDKLAKDENHKPSMDQNKNKHNEEEEKLAQNAKRRDEENHRRQEQSARNFLAEIENKLVGLSPDSPERTRLLALKELYENNSNLI